MTVFKVRSRRAATDGVLLLSACFIVSASGAAFADDFTLQQKVNACHAIADRDSRVACYDQLASPQTPVATLKAPAMPAPASQVSSAPPSVVPQPPESTASPPPNVAQAAAPSSSQTSESLRSDSDEILLGIKSVSILENNRLRLVMSDGITWDQSEDKRVRKMPMPGDVVKISRGWFGYTCKLSRRDQFHCRPPFGLDGKMHNG